MMKKNNIDKSNENDNKDKESNNNNQILEYTNNFQKKNKEEYNKTNNAIDFDEIPIKTNKTLIDFNKGKSNDKINNETPLTKNVNSFQNIDDIVIKPSTSNFMELLEKNLKDEKQNTPNEIKKASTTIVKSNNEKVHQQKSINIDNNNKKLNLEINDPSMEKLLKQEKIKQYKEKAKEIEKSIFK